MKSNKSKVMFIVVVAAAVAALTTAVIFLMRAKAKRRCTALCQDAFDCDLDDCGCFDEECGCGAEDEEPEVSVENDSE